MADPVVHKAVWDEESDAEDHVEQDLQVTESDDDSEEEGEEQEEGEEAVELSIDEPVQKKKKTEKQPQPVVVEEVVVKPVVKKTIKPPAEPWKKQNRNDPPPQWSLPSNVSGKQFSVQLNRTMSEQQHGPVKKSKNICKSKEVLLTEDESEGTQFFFHLPNLRRCTTTATQS